ncbi:MAG: hypothetical protein J6L65_05495 [Lachnospiraceae bacterium]|nr:hypothetical protein [Lachnospiraceae bacterium]
MNKKLKTTIIITMLVTMICGTGIVTNAAELETRDQHTCAYSFMGSREVSRMHVSTHSYLHYNAQTQMYETRDCRIYNVVYENVYKCACGKTNNETYSVVEHSEYHN